MTKDEDVNNDTDNFCKENFKSENTFLSLNLESLKEKQLHQDESDQSNSMKNESPTLGNVILTLHEVRAELEILGVEINTRVHEPWQEVQLQRLVTLYTSVNKAILNLEDYVKQDPHFSKTTEKGRVYKNDSDVAPKHEPGLDTLEETHLSASSSPIHSNKELSNLEDYLEVNSPEYDNDQNFDIDEAELEYPEVKTEMPDYLDDIKDEDDSNINKPEVTTNRLSNKIIQCLVCREKLKGLELKEHTFEEHGEGPYECILCQKAIESLKELQEHRLNHYGKEIVNCKICKKKMARSSLTVHMKYHTGLQECPICYKKFTTAELKFHMKGTHLGEKPFSCETCGKSFVKANYLKEHSRVHTGERPYKCKLCDKSYKQRSHLRTHISAIHDEEDNTCAECGKEHANYEDLKEHVEVEHEGSDVKVKKKKQKEGKMCGVCGKVLANVVSMKIHERTHTGEKPYKCDMCPKSFTQTSALMSHKDTHNTTLIYSCDKCGKAFKHKQYLQRHLKNHDEPKTYSCTICSITYTDKSNLNRHVRVTHKGVKPFSCEVCKQAFSSTTILKQHIRVHTGEKPFKCDVCNKSFTQNSSLYMHRKKCH